MNRLLIPLALLALLVCSCSSREEHIADLAKTQARSWLRTYYNPMGDVSYSDESVYVNDSPDNPLLTPYASWSADVVCTPRWNPDSIVVVHQRVRIEMNYLEDEDQVEMTSQNYTDI